MSNHNNDLAYVALSWHLDQGADEVLQDAPVDRTAMPELEKTEVPQNKIPANTSSPSAEIPGAAQAKKQAAELAESCKTLEDLQKAIADFEGLSIKKTATNMVFADGNRNAKIMLVGEAPDADEDRQGKPFVGASGQLLDKILACINISRKETDPDKAVYISNILNWRPPGNRTPTDSEIEIARPFIEKHIDLIAPNYLIICGSVAAKGVLKTSETIGKMRGKFHTCQTISGKEVAAIVTYHPSYLLRTPSQKGKVWADMLHLRAKMDSK